MIHRTVLDLIDDLLSGQESSLSFDRLRLIGTCRRIAVRTVFYFSPDTMLQHIIFKVFELVVHLGVSVCFSSIDIIQLVQDDIKSFFQAVEMNDLFSILAGAFGPEISIDKQKRFDRQILKFQIPGRMIRCDMRDNRQFVPVQTVIGIVIVQIRDAVFLMFPAAVFANVMGGSRSGYQPQIDWNSGIVELPGGIHGDIVNSADMPECIERCDVRSDPHEFIDIKTSDQLLQFDVTGDKSAVFDLCVRKEKHVFCGIKGTDLTFVSVNSAKKLQKTVPVSRIIAGIRLRIQCQGQMREQLIAQIKVGVHEPSVRRFSGSVSVGLLYVFLPDMQNILRLESSVCISQIQKLSGSLKISSGQLPAERVTL